MTETIAQKALRLLEPIPENEWTVGRFTNEINSCCALGHYSRLLSNNPKNYSSLNCDEYTVQYELSGESWAFLRGRDEGITHVNDGLSTLYQESTPKARIIHLLKDMIAAGY